MLRIALLVTGLFGIGLLAYAEEPAIRPIRVCEVLQDPAAYNGKVVAVVGRYSFRATGRFLSEENCGAPNSPKSVDPSPHSTILPVAFDQKLSPKTPEHLEIEAGAVGKLLKLIQQNTALAKFRFGTPDYDRWAVVYGRVEPAKSAHVELICAGGGIL